MKHCRLTTEKQITAYLHRTRMQIVAELQNGAATVTQIAKKLGVHPANLTRNFRILSEAGLIELVEKRDTGQNLEKWYATLADSFEIVPSDDELAAFRDSVIEEQICQANDTEKYRENE